MREYFTEAIVLEKEGAGEADARIILYTEKLGRVVARATSARKITSKLAAHLEPKNAISIRLIERRSFTAGWLGFRVADALTIERVAVHPGTLRLIATLAPEGEPAPRLWQLLRSGKSTAALVLAQLGFDPRFASCGECGRHKPSRFILRQAGYLCDQCFKRIVGAVRTPLALNGAIQVQNQERGV